MPSRSPGNIYLLTRPGMFLLHVPAVLAVVAAVLLGNWQLGAWQMHREDRAAELVHADPVPLADVLGRDAPFPGDGVGRPVTMTGRWLPDDLTYIADHQNDGRSGYWVVVPLLTCGDGGTGCPKPSAMPVVLGWSATVADAAKPPTGEAEVTGWLQPGESDGGPDDDPTDRVLPALRIADLLQRVQQDLYGGFVILEEPAAARGGMAAVTPDSLPKPPTSTALRNFLYGVEWYLFGGFAVFLWWRWSRDELAAARARIAAEDAEDAGGPPAEEEPQEGAATARIPSEP